MTEEQIFQRGTRPVDLAIEAARRQIQEERERQERKAAATQDALDGSGAVPDLLNRTTPAGAIKNSLFKPDGFFRSAGEIAEEIRDNALERARQSGTKKEISEPESVPTKGVSNLDLLPEMAGIAGGYSDLGKLLKQMSQKGLTKMPRDIDEVHIRKLRALVDRGVDLEKLGVEPWVVEEMKRLYALKT